MTVKYSPVRALSWAETNILINIREHSINTAIIQLGILPCFVFLETCSIHTW